MHKIVFLFTGLLVFAGCAILTPAGKSVKIADPSQLSELGPCRELGKVVESSEHGKQNLIVLMKNTTASMGGNVLVSKLQTEQTFGVMKAAETTQGKAFSCSESVLSRIHSAEDF